MSQRAVFRLRGAPQPPRVAQCHNVSGERVLSTGFAADGGCCGDNDCDGGDDQHNDDQQQQSPHLPIHPALS